MTLSGHDGLFSPRHVLSCFVLTGNRFKRGGRKRNNMYASDSSDEDGELGERGPMTVPMLRTSSAASQLPRSTGLGKRGAEVRSNLVSAQKESLCVLVEWREHSWVQHPLTHGCKCDQSCVGPHTCLSSTVRQGVMYVTPSVACG